MAMREEGKSENGRWGEGSGGAWLGRGRREHGQAKAPREEEEKKRRERKP
jgi:hypothetical protein